MKLHSRKIMRVACRLAGLGLVVASLLFFTVFLLLGYTPLGNRAGDRLQQRQTEIESLEPADFIVVLGGNVVRAVDAARLFHHGLAPHVVLSGGREDHWSALLLCGIPEESLLRDPEPARTADHPRTIADLAEVAPESRLILVTNGLHHRRARRLFEKAGYFRIQMFEYEAPDRPDRIGLGPRGAVDALYEMAAALKDRTL